MIESFKEKDPMYYSITKEEKKELCYRKIEKTYYIHEINFTNIIYKDFNGNKIISKISNIKIDKKEKYKFTDTFLYRHKRLLGFAAGGVFGGIFIVGLSIPGINALEIGFLGSLVSGVIIESGTGFFVFKKGMKSTLEKIKDNEIKSIEEFEDNK